MSPAEPRHGPSGGDAYQRLTEPLLARASVSRSTMMGLPCLRIGGAFFASYDTRTGRLLVKLPESTVQELLADGLAEPFAPAGRTFRQWAAIPAGRLDEWTGLLTAALDFVSGLPTQTPAPRRGKGKHTR